MLHGGAVCTRIGLKVVEAASTFGNARSSDIINSSKRQQNKKRSAFD